MLKMTNRTKVVCLVCKHTYLAREDRIDKESKLPQFYPCPVCKRVRRVRVISTVS